MTSLIDSSRREHEGTDTYVFGFRAVHDMAPGASGVYTIYTSQQWLYVGESDDIRQSLFEHLNAPGACMNRRGPLSYSFELVPAAERAARRQALIAALVPACNSAMR